MFFKISNCDLMRPFFMSIVSDSNHWMFISSNGGLSAGRKNAEFALFPYYTDDKITEFADITGSKTIFQIESNNENYFEEMVSETALKEIKKDISTIMQENGICIFLVNAGNNEYLMQFNIGAEKGDVSFDNGIYFSDKEKLNQYFNKAKLISEKYEKSIAKHATVGKPEKNHIANFIQYKTKNDLLMLHVNVSILKSNGVEYYQYISDFASIFKDDTI
jgi:hypothetical protein